MHRFYAAVYILLLQFSLYAQSFTVTATNPSDFERKYETVEVRISQIFKTGKNAQAVTAKVTDATKANICSQIIPAQDAGSEDMLIFQSDFKPKEKKKFKVTITNFADRCTPLTDGKFVLPREDYAWESDRIAFRVYGPALAKDVNNGIDLWTKRVGYPIVAKWYKMSEGSAPGKDTYHIDKGEGADFFSVGRTLGAGSSSLYYKDSLFQPGVFSRYKTITTGPIRVCFELYYDNLLINNVPVTETKRISIDAHSNFNTITETFEFDTKKLPDCKTFAAGLVKRKNVTASYSNGQSWMTLWGMVNDDSVNGELGMALILPKKYAPSVSETASQFLMKGKMSENLQYTYYAGAGWTRQGICSDESGWKELTAYVAACKEQPLIVTIRK